MEKELFIGIYRILFLNKSIIYNGYSWSTAPPPWYDKRSLLFYEVIFILHDDLS